jgi:hypothetical protein
MPSMDCAKEKPNASVIITLLLHVSRLLDLSCLTILYPENEVLKKFRPRTAIRLKKVYSISILIGWSASRSAWQFQWLFN